MSFFLVLCIGAIALLIPTLRGGDDGRIGDDDEVQRRLDAAPGGEDLRERPTCRERVQETPTPEDRENVEALRVLAERHGRDAVITHRVAPSATTTLGDAMDGTAAVLEVCVREKSGLSEWLELADMLRG